MPIPPDHAQGLFWYHPHFHPWVNTQIAGGLSGGLIVGDILSPFPELAGIPERVMLLKDLKVKGGEPVLDPDPSGPTRRTVNGLWKARLTMQPGQLEFWRIGNIGANIYYQLRFEGQPFYVLAQDGNLKNQIVETETLLLPPGQRAEVLVYGPHRRGTYRLRAQRFGAGTGGRSLPGTGAPVGRVARRARGPATAAHRAAGGAGSAQRPADGPHASSRTPPIRTSSPSTIGPTATGCVNTIVPLGSIEEWTIINTAMERHVFHIHQLDFQVTAVNGQQPFTGYQDTIDLPPAPRK